MSIMQRLYDSEINCERGGADMQTASQIIGFSDMLV